MIAAQARQVMELVEKNNLGERCSIYVNVGRTGGLIEPKSREEYSREIDQGEGAINKYLKKLPEEYLM